MPERPYIPARPTTYQGIKMRSRLEATFAASIPSHFKWEYEPMCFASGKTQYLPDFKLVEEGHEDTPDYVEVKPFLDDPEPLQRRMAVIWDSEPDARLVIAVPGKAPMIGELGHWS